MHTPGTSAGSDAVDFDDFAATYESLLDNNLKLSGEAGQYFSAYKASYVARQLGEHAGRKILEYGCGVGLLSLELKRRLPACHLHGYDVSQDSIACIPESLGAQGLFTSDWRIVDGGFDTAVIANTLHHIPPAQRQFTIDEIADRLRPGGHLVIFEHNPANPLTRRTVNLCPFDGDAILLPADESCAYVRQAGLMLLRRDFIVFFPRFLKWLRALEPSLGWCGLGAQYAVIAMKRPIWVRSLAAMSSKA